MKRITYINSQLVSFFVVFMASVVLSAFVARTVHTNNHLSGTKIANNTKGKSFLDLIGKRRPQYKLNPNFAQLDGDLPVTQVSGALSSNQTWTSDSVYLVGNVTVPNGVTLTISAGTIVKTTSSYSTGITVEQGGTLHVSGSTSDPVIFTSYKDDSVGGDSNNDGPSINSYNDYSTGISANDGALDVTHAIFRGGSQGVRASCTSSPAGVSISDSVINSQVYATNCGASVVSLARNELAVQGGANAVYFASGDPSGILLAGANQNTATGSDAGNVVFVNSATVSSGSTWSISGTSGAVVMTGNLNVNGTMNLSAGAIVKTTSSYASGIVVSQSGTLNASGTSGDPVIFTSYKDDNAGGDSNNDGSSLGGYYDYSTGVRTDSGSVNIAHAIFRAGSQGLFANCSSGAGNVVVTDSTLNSQAAFSNCGQGVVTMQRNQFAAQGGNMAVQVSYSDVAGIALGGATQNVATGTNRSEERSGGKECTSWCSSAWAPYH